MEIWFPNETCVLTMQNNQNRNKRHFQSHHIWVMWIFIEIIFIHYIFNEIAVDDNVLKIRQQQCNFYRWIEAFRTHSHLIAQTNPIELKKNTRYSYNHLFSFSFFFLEYTLSFFHRWFVAVAIAISVHVTARSAFGTQRIWFLAGSSCSCCNHSHLI